MEHIHINRVSDDLHLRFERGAFGNQGIGNGLGNGAQSLRSAVEPHLTLWETLYVDIQGAGFPPEPFQKHRKPEAIGDGDIGRRQSAPGSEGIDRVTEQDVSLDRSAAIRAVQSDQVHTVQGVPRGNIGVIQYKYRPIASGV